MQELKIIKVGGAILEDDKSLESFIRRFSNIKGNKILVHGGGREATKVASALGIETRTIDGRRITDAETLKVVTMVYGGSVNRNLVSRLQQIGINAIGLTGADLRCVESKKRPIVNGIDFGYVGDVEKIDGNVFRNLIDIEATPIVAPLSFDPKVGLLNTNADTMASAIAVEMSRYFTTTLVYCFEKPGVLSDPENEESVVHTITEKKFDSLVDSGIVSGGMIPKIENALKAVKKGVAKVVITNIDNIDNPGNGTLITLE